MVIFRYRRTASILSGIAALIAVSVVLTTALQKVRTSAHRLNDT